MSRQEPERPRVLVVDDEENIRLVLATALEEEGYEVAQAADGQEGLTRLDQEVFDFILLDVRMPRLDGLELLERITRRGVTAPVIMLSAYGTADSALLALKKGAFDYVFKPFNPDEVVLSLARAAEQVRLRRENQALRRAAGSTGSGNIVARSPAMRALTAMLERVAQADSPVLISGESGTGKELIARAIHQQGPLAAGPFVAVNCGAIPGELLESELFGHVKGAFTGAHDDHGGLFREAEGGLLFLDEIGELPLALQVKLLRAIETREVRPVGSARAVGFGARIVAATNRDLAAEVEAGRFRKDLYYRLNVLPLAIPPLRDRPEDVLLLLDHFLTVFSARLGRPRPRIALAAANLLAAYHWPGNVRELENLVERMLVLLPGQAWEAGDLPEAVRRGSSGPTAQGQEEEDLDLKAGVRALEARFIARALKKFQGNRSAAARGLGLSYPSLLSKIKLYGLEDH